jgi:hypothetical protein
MAFALQVWKAPMIVDDPRMPRRPPVTLVPDSPGPDKEANASESEMPLPSPDTFFLGVLLSCQIAEDAA